MGHSDNSGIIRTRRDRNNPYAMVNKAAFEDERLTWEARGILAYLLTKPDDWQVRTNDLLNRAPDCKLHKLTRILKELETAGYLVRERKNVAGGKFEWVTTVYENPLDAQEVTQKTGNRRNRKKVQPYPENQVMATLHQEAKSTITGLSINGSSINGKSPYIENTESNNSIAKAIEDETPRKARRPTPSDKKEPTPIVIREALADVCKVDMKIGTKEQKLQVNSTAQALYEQGQKAGKAPDEIAASIRYVAGWFGRNDWRGKRGETPTPSLIREVWRAAIESRDTRPAALPVPTPKVLPSKEESERARRAMAEMKPPRGAR
jgi:DNA-binding HxlR family transcriptional regulator